VLVSLVKSGWTSGHTLKGKYKVASNQRPPETVSRVRTRMSSLSSAVILIALVCLPEASC
jgi:hypothetical protein